jgi:hypothetical protein
MALDVAEEICRNGIEPHYVHVISVEPSDRYLQYLHTRTELPAGLKKDDLATMQLVVKDSLLSLGIPQAQVTGLMERASSGYAILMATIPEYQTEAIEEIIKKAKPTRTDDQELQWSPVSVSASNVRPPGYTPAPTTGELYAEVESEMQGLALADRTSPYFEHYTRTYAQYGLPFGHYLDAYAFGAEQVKQSDPGKTWESVRSGLRNIWEQVSEKSTPTWDEVSDAIQFAWHQAIRDEP